MEIIKWSKDLESDVQAFNGEHKFLVDTINNIYTLLKEGKKDEAKKLLVEKAVSYTDKHFKHEEEVMERYGYPKEELEKHKKIHRFFVRYVVETLAPKIENGGDKEFRDALNFIIGWLVMHIKNMDVKGYGKWFKEKGIEVPDKMVEI
ncbi:bacteriohemerythrin [Methanothermococcus okinawensis]|uniref:Hemerythrin-like metal-binding protein n=1 Tax=Methanothermococcus okinawensis (strain DSM 14208 / JCM 11175 / IH1) TaxID=647113 RepID=F8ALQ3_METOI|nr:hemerythrin family protein [Methanothermococcus okinawensis]AEH06601.1 hemerythrin-like metal-binding protein [Methanothermococcus okinawensis IH1]